MFLATSVKAVSTTDICFEIFRIFTKIVFQSTIVSLIFSKVTESET